jgi:hypothetical protein
MQSSKSPEFYSTHQEELVDKLLLLTQEGSAPDCFVEELVEKGAEESIFILCKRLPPLQIT